MKGVNISLHLFGVCLLLLFGVSFIAGSTTDTPTLKPIIYQELGGDENHVRSKRSAPNSTTIADLEKINDLNVLGFYIALRELYLTGGFEMSNPFNTPILQTPAIPDMIWQELIRSFEQSRFEIKRGEMSLRKIQGMIKLNEPDSLIHQPSLSNLALLILENSKNPKNVAYSIRDLGVYLLDKGFPRVGYENGTILRETIKKFTNDEFKTEESSGFDWTEHLTVLHHIIGPENFNSFGDVIESMPWLVNGMYNGDAEFVRLYQYRLNEAIADADVTVILLNQMKNGLRSVTGSADSEHTSIERLASAEMIPDPNLSIFKDVSGGSGGLAEGSQPTRKEKALTSLSTIWGEIQNVEAKKRFASAAEKALSSGTIGGLEGIKNALFSGARLSKNLGGTQNAIQKCEELKQMGSSPVSSMRFWHAVEIVKKLPGKLENGTTGYQILFDLFINFKGPSSDPLFYSTRGKDWATMEKFFKDVNLPSETGFLDLLTCLRRDKRSLRHFQHDVSKLDNDRKLLKYFERYFNFRTTESDGRLLRTALQAIRDISTSDYDFMDYIKSLRAIYKTSNPGFVFQSISSLSKLGWNKRWMDVSESLQHIHFIVSGPSSSLDSRIAVFKNLNTMISSDASYTEVFYSLQSLLDLPSALESKCQFITDFFSGLENVEATVNAFGIDTDNTRFYEENTKYIDVLVDLLRVTQSHTNLGRLIGWHTAHTVNRAEPSLSLEMIGDLIEFLLNRGN